MWVVTAADAMPLQRAVEEVLEDPALQGASVSVMVGPSDTPWVDVDADRRLTPASVAKWLTAVALAEAHPLDAVLTTELRAVGEVEDGVLRGDLWIVGAGDPSLAWPDPALQLAPAAQAVKAAGITRITGSVVVDPAVFDGAPYGAGWMWDDLDASWSPAVRGASAMRGIATGPCTGRAGIGSPAVSPPECLARHADAALEAAGVVVDGEPAERVGVPAATAIATIDSPPLRELVRVMLVESDNGYAEALWRLTDPARPATEAGAMAAVGALLEGVGSPDRPPVDGSGLSRYSHLSARALVQVTEFAATRPYGDELRSLLPVAGESGTLLGRDDRVAGQIAAKTGSMTGVRNLVGWVRTQDGLVPFAIGFEGFVAPQADLIAVQDRILTLATHSRRGKLPSRTARDIVAPPG